ncbi:MAG: hypothetical protein QXQ33_00720 [Nitrososphaerota archaeon]
MSEVEQIIYKVTSLASKTLFAVQRTLKIYFQLGMAIEEAKNKGLTYEQIYKYMKMAQKDKDDDVILKVYTPPTLWKVHQFALKVIDYFGGDINRLEAWMRSKNMSVNTWSAILYLLKYDYKPQLDEKLRVDPEENRVSILIFDDKRQKQIVKKKKEVKTINTYDDERHEEEEIEISGHEEGEEEHGKTCAVCGDYAIANICAKHLALLKEVVERFGG